jgi:hypothetical protein
MSIVRRYDAFMLGQVERLVTWCEEWLSISQRRLESACIVAYGVVFTARTIAAHAWPGLLLVIWVTSILWAVHRLPQATRTARAHPGRDLFIHIFADALIGLRIVSMLLVFSYSDVSGLLEGALLSLIVRMLDIASNGDVGRKRKLSLAKLKELFGAGWMVPQPVGKVAALAAFLCLEIVLASAQRHRHHRDAIFAQVEFQATASEGMTGICNVCVGFDTCDPEDSYQIDIRPDYDDLEGALATVRSKGAEIARERPPDRKCIETYVHAITELEATLLRQKEHSI